MIVGRSGFNRIEIMFRFRGDRMLAEEKSADARTTAKFWHKQKPGKMQPLVSPVGFRPSKHPLVGNSRFVALHTHRVDRKHLHHHLGGRRGALPGPAAIADPPGSFHTATSAMPYPINHPTKPENINGG